MTARELPVVETVTLQRESFAAFFPEARALLLQHWQEIAAYPDIPLNVALERYLEIDAAGRLVVLTAREDGRLVGYAAFFLDRHLHYAGSLQAVEDVLYLDEAHRGRFLGVRLIRYADTVLRELGVQVVHHHVKVRHPALGVVLQRCGYEQVEALYSKRLDQE